MSNLFVDKISGKSGTSSGAPITLSGDTATLSSGVDLSSATIPAAGITGAIPSTVTGLGWQPVGSEQETFATNVWHITGFTDDFNIWMVQINYMRPASDAKELRMQFLLDDDSVATGTQQYYSSQYDSGGSSDAQSNTSFSYVGAQMSNASLERSTGSVIVYGARDTNQNTTAWVESNMVKPDGQVGTDRGSTLISGGEVIGGLKLFPWAGAWAEVSAQIYGLKSIT